MSAIALFVSALSVPQMPLLLLNRQMPVTTCVPIKAARAHHILFSVIVPSSLIMPIQTTLAAHMAAMEKDQSSPPMMMPFTG